MEPPRHHRLVGRQTDTLLMIQGPGEKPVEGQRGRTSEKVALKACHVPDS